MTACAASSAFASYNATAKTLHWLIGFAIIFMLCLGWSFDFLPKGETKFFFIQLHKSIGLTILMLVFLRLAWRFLHTPPAFPAQMPLWEQRAAHMGHLLLYIAMIGMPLSGWAMVSASPRNVPTIFFGLFAWPPIPFLSDLENKKEISNLFGDVHGLGGTLIALLIAGHAAAALKHHFISRDDVLLRMAPRWCIKFLNRLRGKA